MAMVNIMIESMIFTAIKISTKSVGNGRIIMKTAIITMATNTTSWRLDAAVKMAFSLFMQFLSCFVVFILFEGLASVQIF
jgi:hypothetical protein